MLPCKLNIKGAYKCFWAIYEYSVGLSGAPEIILGETSWSHQIDQGPVMTVPRVGCIIPGSG